MSRHPSAVLASVLSVLLGVIAWIDVARAQDAMAWLPFEVAGVFGAFFLGGLLGSVLELLFRVEPGVRVSPRVLGLWLVLASCGRATVFPNMHTVAPWTVPSHASLFTGKLPYEHGTTAEATVLDQDEVTLAETLRDAGSSRLGRLNIEVQDIVSMDPDTEAALRSLGYISEGH